MEKFRVCSTSVSRAESEIGWQICHHPNHCYHHRYDRHHHHHHHQRHDYQHHLHRHRHHRRHHPPHVIVICYSDATGTVLTSSVDPSAWPDRTKPPCCRENALATPTTVTSKQAKAGIEVCHKSAIKNAVDPPPVTCCYSWSWMEMDAGFCHETALFAQGSRWSEICSIMQILHHLGLGLRCRYNRTQIYTASHLTARTGAWSLLMARRSTSKSRSEFGGTGPSPEAP